MSILRLNLLPVELFYHLFTYFLAHEILLTFSDVSDYVDAILLSYSTYRVDLKSIRKDHFDLICRRIHPNQIISLVISDDNDTPGLSELFFSRYAIEQLTQLRSLTLIEIEIDSLKLILPNLSKLHQLRSLSFNILTIRHRYPRWNNDHFNESTRFQTLLDETYSQVLPQLKYIDLNHSNDIVSLSLPCLRHLKLATFSEDELEMIFSKSSQLKSLEIVLHMNVLESKFLLPSNQLIRLDLKIENRRISRNEIERFLSSVPHLRHLNLEILARADVANGHFWQPFAHSLRTFNFKFSGLTIPIDRIFDSFLTPFWLEEKHCFVGYLDGSLFSIPYFVPTHIDSLNLMRFRSTAPDHSLIYKQLNKLTMNAILKKINPRLTHVKILVLEWSIALKISQSSIDFNQIEHLVVSSLDKLLIFMPLESIMPRLNKLTVKHRITMEMIEQIRCYPLAQIRILEVDRRILHEYIDCIIEELFHLFPRLEHLFYRSSIESVAMMIRLINGFRYLSSASFSADPLFFRKAKQVCRNLRQEIRDHTTYRIYHSTNTQRPFFIHWRIDQQPVRRFSWRRGYYWYRFKYILLRSSYKNLLSIQYSMQFLIYLPITIIILRPYYNDFDRYFLCFCSINTVFLTIFYNLFHRLSNSIKNDNDYTVLVWRVYVWFACCLVAFLFSFTIQFIYNSIL